MPYADGDMGHGGSMLGKYDALEIDTFRPKRMVYRVSLREGMTFDGLDASPIFDSVALWLVRGSQLDVVRRIRRRGSGMFTIGYRGKAFGLTV